MKINAPKKTEITLCKFLIHVPTSLKLCFLEKVACLPVKIAVLR